MPLNPEGRELYAITPQDHTLYVLDAFSGEVQRRFDKTLTELLGFMQLQ